MSDPAQQTIFQAIAMSSMSLSGVTQRDREQSFRVLEDLKKFDGRIPLVLQWLGTDRHFFEQHDITTATKLLALDILSAFLVKGYAGINETDRLQLRRGVLSAAILVASGTIDEETRILSKKLASLLEGLVVREFPQRWTTFSSDVFSTQRNHGLWYNEPGAEATHHPGVRICLECLKLIAEDCTDSDFNAKISVARRNDVLIGLNEVSGEFLPLFFQLLEHYPLLQQSKAALHIMHTFLASNNRTIHSLNAEESSQYRDEVRRRNDTAQMIADCLITLEKFCCSMPMSWIIGGSVDFIPALLHLLREPDRDIQVRAVECLDQLAVRGKLEYPQWMRLISELPPAVGEANAYSGSEQERVAVENAARGQSGSPPDSLALAFEFHRSLSRMLSNMVQCYVSFINNRKNILEKKGADYESLSKFLRLLVDMLRHPSGRVCSEQLNVWTSLLRDPQIVKTELVQVYYEDVLTCFVDHMTRIRWGDVEDESHSMAQLLETSYEDEEGYEAWLSDFRSRASTFYRFLGNCDPRVCSKVLSQRIITLLNSHGQGQPQNHLDPSNQQLTQKSDAVLHLEGIHHAMDNMLNGFPEWSLSNKAQSDAKRAEMRQATQASMGEVAQALVSWEPSFLWLRFRRAQILDALKHYWSKCDDQVSGTTLLTAVDSLLKYLGLADEWSTNAQIGSVSAETTGLKKKSGVTLVSVSKRVPTRLVPWLGQLSDATRTLLSSEGLIPMNQMHLYEFLTCVATAVDDPTARSNFVGGVLSDALLMLEEPGVQHMISSTNAMLDALGVFEAARNPTSVTDRSVVDKVQADYNRLFVSLNRLLSVGKRCNEASRKDTILNGLPLSRIDQSQLQHTSDTQNFPDEGPLSIQQLAISDPFAPLWPRIIVSLLNTYESVIGIWKPEFQAQFLGNSYQRYLFAISDDEAYLSKTHDSKSSGGVFGEGGTAGSVVSGTDRRDVNLVPRWSGWLNELRNTCFQLFGLLATERVMFAPEMSPHFPRLISILTDPMLLKSMEHRQLTQYIKHVLELNLISCPAPLYPTHLAPLVGPAFEHIRFRLEKTWEPILSQSSDSLAEGTRPLASRDAGNAAALAAKGSDDWFSWYYRHAGLFTGDLDSTTAEAAVEKYRVEISRAYSDILQSALALKGDWALVLANRAREEQATKRNNASTLLTGPGSNPQSDDYVELNADGKPKSPFQSAIDARKLRRINGLCHFLLLENEHIAGNLVMAVMQALSYPDAYTCRRITKICHRILETVAWSPGYSQLLGQQMFTQAVKNIVTEPKWMVGIEWDMINVARDIYCRLVLGQNLQFGGQGAGQQQNLLPHDLSQFEQAKTVDTPLQGGGILVSPSNSPRQVLASLPGISEQAIQELERSLNAKRAAKDQKDFIRDLLRVAADNLKDQLPSSNASGAPGLFDRAIEEESLLHSHRRTAAVPDLPEKLVTRSQVEKQQASGANQADEHAVLAAQSLFKA